MTVSCSAPVIIGKDVGNEVVEVEGMLPLGGGALALTRGGEDEGAGRLPLEVAHTVAAAAAETEIECFRRPAVL